MNRLFALDGMPIRSPVRTTVNRESPGNEMGLPPVVGWPLEGLPLFLFHHCVWATYRLIGRHMARLSTVDCVKAIMLRSDSGYPCPLWASSVSFWGIQLVSVGIVGEYVGTTYKESEAAAVPSLT